MRFCIGWTSNGISFQYYCWQKLKIIFQDNDLVLSNQDSTFLTNNGSITFLMKLKLSSKIGELKHTICNHLKINTESSRVLIDGEALNGNEQVYELGLEGGEVVDIFREMSGGGNPIKKNLDEARILEVLNEIDDDSFSFEENTETLDPPRQTIDRLEEDSTTGTPVKTIEKFEEMRTRSLEAVDDSIDDDNEYF